MFYEIYILGIFVYKFCVVRKKPLKHHHNELYSNISKILMFRNKFQKLDVRNCFSNFV